MIMARELVHTYFAENNQEIVIEAFQPGDKRIPYKILDEFPEFEKRVIECENEINKMVYKLYDLSEDEIKFVEGN